MNDNVFSLGMIETLGFPALIAAADAAAKAADVRVVTYEGADAGIVTIYIIGDVSSVQAAVAIGAAEAKRVGQLLHSHVIPRPDQSVSKMMLRMLETVAPTINKPELEAAQEQNAEVVQKQEAGRITDELSQKSLNELRKMARSVPDFPLTSQEINVAKKEELLKHLSDQETERGDASE